MIPPVEKTVFPILILFALLLTGGVLYAQARLEQYAQMPDYATVFEQLSETKLEPEAGNTFFKIVKSERGYEVYPVDSRNRERKGKNQLFWSIESGHYQPLTGNKIVEDKGVSRDNPSLSLSEARNFDLHPFYGYEGWASDVVRVFGKSPALNDQMLNGLGRAYSRIAVLYLSGRSGETPSASALKFNETYDPTVFDADGLKAYEENITMAVATFKRLDKQNPAFPNIVGYPRIKYANEHMTAYLDLMVIGHPKTAKRWLEPDIYPALFLQMARNYLRSCPQNAVLFTAGDNDTYPLLYVQQTEGFRTDVTVINRSLLNTGRYIHYLEHDLEAENRITLSLQFASTYSDRLPAYMIVKDGQPLDAIDFLPTVGASMVSQRPTTAAKTVKFNISPIAWVAQETLPIDARLMPTFEFNAHQYGTYWTREDIFLIDFLQTNAWKRPVCFSSGTDPKSFRGIEDHCWYKGFVYEMLPYVYSNGSLNSRLDTPFDIKSTLDLLIEEWQFNRLKTWDMKIPVGDILGTFPVKQTFILLMDAQKRSSNFDGAPVVIDLYMEHLWATSPGVVYEKILVAEYAMQAGLNRRAFVMLDKQFADCTHMMTQMNAGLEFPQESTDQLRYALEWLPKQYRNLGDSSKAKQVETLQENYIRNHE